MPFDPKAELEEFWVRKQANVTRNREMWLRRQAWENIYSWPVDWSPFKQKVTYPLVGKAVLTHANFLMGRGFTTQVEPLGPNPPQRLAAQRAEKALFTLIDKSEGWRSMWRAAQLGSLLGTSGFKVYLDPGEEKRPCFSAIQPEFLYPVARGDDYSEPIKVFYAYYIDRLEAERRYGRPADSWLSERQVQEMQRGDYINPRGFGGTMDERLRDRRIPVVEVWTDEDYLLWVGGKQIENGDNPYGFLPFVVIPNIDSLRSIEGLSDVKSLLDLNNQLNVLLSEHYYATRRWCNPTLVWEGAPVNAEEIIPEIVGGGGVLNARVGTRVYFLQYTGAGPDMQNLLDRLRVAGVDMSGLNELSWTGQATGSINTGPSLEVNFANVQNTLSAKQQNWQVGLKQLFSMLMRLGSEMDVIGVADDPGARTRAERGTVLKGKDIGGHRNVKITWPGMLAKDDASAARFELEKHGARVQSKATTLENLGFDFPDDELQRIRDEMADKGLNPDEQANLTRAQAAQTRAEGATAGGGDVEGDLNLPDEGPLPGDLGQETDLPPEYGTSPNGQVVDEGGGFLSDLEAQLAQARQRRLGSVDIPPEDQFPEGA